MDRMLACEAGDPGSIPGESTRNMKCFCASQKALGELSLGIERRSGLRTQ